MTTNKTRRTRITRLLDKIIVFLSYLLDCRLVFVPIFIFSTLHIHALSEGQEVCMLGRKYEVLDKPKPVGIQTPAHYSATVLLYKIREIIPDKLPRNPLS